LWSDGRAETNVFTKISRPRGQWGQVRDLIVGVALAGTKGPDQNGFGIVEVTIAHRVGCEVCHQKPQHDTLSQPALLPHLSQSVTTHLEFGHGQQHSNTAFPNGQGGFPYRERRGFVVMNFIKAQSTPWTSIAWYVARARRPLSPPAANPPRFFCANSRAGENPPPVELVTVDGGTAARPTIWALGYSRGPAG